MGKYDNSANSSSSSGGIGFFRLLCIVFIVLKLTNNISWPWLWVLAPLWGPTILVILILIIVGIVTVFKK